MAARTLLSFIIGVGLVQGQLSHPSNSSQSACRSVFSSLGATKVKSAGLQYEASAKGAWNAFNQLDDPTCIVFPESTADVVTAMTAIYQSDSGYAVRGGGHSAMPGWNTIEDGVLIDFSQMKAFSYNQTSNTVTIQPGALWGNIYDGLQSQGVSPVGGRETDVGASGFLLGGGLSYLSPAHGFGCDNYVSLDVVLPSGTLVTATQTNDYADLFRALKGGGSRFGIVTRYEVNAFYTGTALDKTWYGGTVIFANTSGSALAAVRAMDAFVGSNNDPKAVSLLALTNVYVAGIIVPLYAATLFYNGTEAEFNTAFAGFLTDPTSIKTLGPLSYSDITKVLPPGSERTNGNLYGASALYPNQGLFEEAFTHWTNFSNTFRTEMALSVLAFTPVTQNQIDISNANGGTAFSPPNGAYAAVQLGKEFPPGVTTISEELRQGIDLVFEQIPPSSGLPLYLNESDETQDTFATYNWYAQLKQVYSKYDPTRFNVRRLVGPNGL